MEAKERESGTEVESTPVCMLGESQTNGHVATLEKSHINGLLPFESTIEQTTEAMPLALKQ